MKAIATACAVGALALASLAPHAALASDEQTAETGSGPQVTAQRLYDAFAAGDMATIAALLGDDVEWVEAEGGPYEATNPHIGMEAVAAGVFGPVVAAYPDFEATPERFTVEGNRVVSEGRYTGTHGESGETLNAQFVHVFTIDGDRIMAFQQYTDTYQWRWLAGTLGE